MERIKRFIFPYLALEVSTFRLLSIDAGPAINAGVFALQGGLIGWVLLKVSLAVRRARREAGADQSAGNLLRHAVGRIFPGPVGKLMLSELSIWLCFYQLLRRGWRLKPGEFSYHRKSSGLLWLLITVVTAPAELLLIHVLVPWDFARILLLFLGTYSVVWFMALVLAPMVFPHRADERSIVLRSGAMTSIRVRYNQIASIEVDKSALPKKLSNFGVNVIDGMLYLPVEGQAGVRVELREPVKFSLSLDSTVAVTTIRVAADEPDKLVTEIRSRMLQTTLSTSEVDA